MLQAILKRALTFLDAYRKGQRDERARVVRLLRAEAAQVPSPSVALTLTALADKIEGP